MSKLRFTAFISLRSQPTVSLLVHKKWPLVPSATPGTGCRLKVNRLEAVCLAGLSEGRSDGQRRGRILEETWTSYLRATMMAMDGSTAA